jgi:hypothetical protein
MASLDLGSVSIVASFSVAGELTPTHLTELVAAGYMKLCGYGVLETETSSELTSAFAADGCLQIAGEGVLSAPEMADFVADGSYALGGTGVLDFRVPDAYQAAGYMGLSGTCHLTSVTPTPVISQYEAGGILALLGPCSLNNVLPQGSDYVAAGFYSLSGRPAFNVVMPSSLWVNAYAAAGCYELSGPCRNPRGLVTAYAADTRIGPVLQVTSRATVGFTYPQITALVAEGGYVLESPELPDEGVFETLVLTGSQSEVSIYSNFNFNSYAKYGGKYYGATQDGIFLLEGKDDAGAPIHSGAQIGPVNFGTDREKRLRLIRCGGECDEAQVRVSDGNGKSGQFPVRGGRSTVSRNVQGRELTIEIVDFKSLNHLEIIPLVLAKR